MNTLARENDDTLTLRVKIALTVICLLIALMAAGLAVKNTVQAFHSLQQQHELAKSGDVRTISSWMTIPYIARTYHVPEAYLYQKLNLNSHNPPRHATLHALATHSQKPVDSLIHDVQSAIVLYRRAHPHARTPPAIPTALPQKRSVLLFNPPQPPTRSCATLCVRRVATNGPSRMGRMVY